MKASTMEMALADRYSTQEYARSLLACHGDSSLDSLRLTSDKSLFFSPSRRSYLAYREASGHAVVLGAPVGPADEWDSLIDAFQRLGQKPIFCGITEASLPFFRRRDYSVVKVGDDTAVSLESMSLQGGRWREVRAALNRASRRGITFRFLPWHERSDQIISALNVVSRQWLSSKSLPELAFGLGTASLLRDPYARIGAAFRPDGRLEGFVTWLPNFRQQGWTLDMMRRRPDTMSGLMDFLIARSLLSMRDEGVTTASLGAVPFSNITREPGGILRKTLDALFTIGVPAYAPRRLLHFKKKFNPRWSPLYMACPPGVSRPVALWATFCACIPGLKAWQVLLTLLSAS